MSLDLRHQKENLLRFLLSKKMERDKNRLSLFKPNPGFQEAFQKSKKLLRLVTSGNQPLSLDTLVSSPNGEVTLRSIKAGDYVFSVDGNPCKVNYIVRPGKKEV